LGTTRNDSKNIYVASDSVKIVHQQRTLQE
jgi:hypothetical protein